MDVAKHNRKHRTARVAPPPVQQVLPDVHPELRGFNVSLNRFGQVDMTISIDVLNDFLDREVADPKLVQWGFSDEDEEE